MHLIGSKTTEKITKTENAYDIVQNVSITWKIIFKYH